jgi:hypothetical protein
MTILAMVGLLLLTPAVDAAHTDVASSEAIICVECSSEAAAREVALYHVSQQECESSSGRQQDQAFCRTHKKRVLVLNPYNNQIYRYVIGDQRDGALSESIIDSDAAMTHAERQYFTKMMDDYRAVTRFYQEASSQLGDALARPVAQMPPAHDAMLAAQRATQQCPSELQATALKAVVDTRLLEDIHNSARAIFAENISDSILKNAQAGDHILNRLTRLNVAINNGMHGDSFGITLTPISNNALKLTVPIKRQNEVGQRNDYLVFDVTYSGTTNTYYPDLNGALVYTEHFPLVSFRLNVSDSVILGSSGFAALDDLKSDNPCVAAVLKKAAKKERIRPVVSADYMKMYMSYHDVTVNLQRRFICVWNVFEGQGNFQNSTWCNARDRDHRKAP